MNKNSKNDNIDIDIENHFFLKKNENKDKINNINQDNEIDKDFNEKYNINNLQDMIKDFQNDDDEINFLFTKLDKSLKDPIINLINHYNIEHLESFDYEKVLNPEISAVFNLFLTEIQNSAYKRIMDNFDLYYEKYNLKERLKKNSKLIILKMILVSLNLKPEEFIQILKSYKEEHNKQYSIFSKIKDFTKNKIKSLNTYKEKLRLELENLKKANQNQ